MTLPIVWSIAGTDSGGGAGLSADQRAAEAFGVHLCPVVAAVTAQNSLAVARVQAVGAPMLDAQLAALADDMPAAVIKTGLLASAEQIERVAHWVDRLRERGPVGLVVDPVLGATTGASFADASVLDAYRKLLLPRATVLTPNRREAAMLLGTSELAGDGIAGLPGLSAALRGQGAGAVCITGGDGTDLDGRVLDWMDTEHAQGWLALPRVDTPHHHGTGCTFASSVAAGLARGFVPADAIVLAKMATTQALRHAHAAGSGAGPVGSAGGFVDDASLVPQLSFCEKPRFAAPRPAASQPLGLYAIVDTADRVRQVLAAGVRCVQLRIKPPAAVDRRVRFSAPSHAADWQATISDEVRRSVAACREAGALLFVNDHWMLALEHGAAGVHLGQEDLLALDQPQRDALAASGLQLGISSHSLWELCRARSLAPRYVACGPVWPTLTKAMPWRAQGLQNLSWWCAMAGAPVVAIGGILATEQAEAAARSGADGVCLVRALGDTPALSVPAFDAAWCRGRDTRDVRTAPGWPSPSLDARRA